MKTTAPLLASVWLVGADGFDQLGVQSWRPVGPSAGKDSIFRRLGRSFDPASELGRSLEAQECRYTSLVLFPPQSVDDFNACWDAKYATQDMAVPGAAVDISVECWCQHNMTGIIKEYGCCSHDNFRPWCTTDCTPDCASAPAVKCVSDCHSMCLEDPWEYDIDDALCSSCDVAACFPYIQCITNNAEALSVTGDVQQTCHEHDFGTAPQLQAYRNCWKSAPKHTSDWLILSSDVNCICKTGMVQVVTDNSCCGSFWYNRGPQGSGVCNLQCQDTASCNSAEGQNCRQKCLDLCKDVLTITSQECHNQCKKKESVCWKYATCDPQAPVNYICDDGSTPAPETGCCGDAAQGSKARCPKTCDRARHDILVPPHSNKGNHPWFVKNKFDWRCKCSECPTTTAETATKLKTVVDKDLYMNGQKIVAEIAWKNGLNHPTARMQEIVADRNQKIVAAINVHGELPNDKTESEIARINEEYRRLLKTEAIAAAAGNPSPPLGRVGPKKSKKGKDDDDNTVLIIVIIGAAVVVLGAVAAAAVIFMKKGPSQAPPAQQAVSASGRVVEGSDVVIGQPVASSSAAASSAAGGAPVQYQQDAEKGQGSDGKAQQP